MKGVKKLPVDFDEKEKYYQIEYKRCKVRYRPVAKFPLEDGTMVKASNMEEAKDTEALHRAQLAFPYLFKEISKAALDNYKKDKMHIEDLYTKYKKSCIHTLDRHDLVDRYCGYFKDYIADFYKRDVPVEDITPSDVENYRNFRLEAKIYVQTKRGEKWTGRYIKVQTVKREVNSIQGMFSYAIETLGIIEKNPCKKIPELQNKETVVKVPFTEEQEKQIFEMTKDTYMYPILLCLDLTGQRIDEVLKTKWKNVHFEITEIFNYGYIYVVDTKNNENRIIPMSLELREELKKLEHLSEYVFTNPKTMTRYKTIRKRFNTILTKIGITYLGKGFHIFRHTFASKLERAGIDPTTIQELLGHKNKATTAKYTHSNMKIRQSAVSLISKNTKVTLNASCELSVLKEKRQEKLLKSATKFKILRIYEEIQGKTDLEQIA